MHYDAPAVHQISSSPRLFLPVAATIAALLLTACGGERGGSEASAASPKFLIAAFTTLIEWSPDGSRSVIYSGGAGTFARYPAVSPDGKQIAFSRQKVGAGTDNDVGADIVVLDRSSGEARELVHHPAPGQYLGSPMWVDGGKRLLYSVRGPDERGQPDLYIAGFDLSTGASRRIISAAAEPAISADGKKLTFVSLDSSLDSAELVTTNLDGSGRQTVVEVADGYVGILSAVFSPDGKRIAFAARRREEVTSRPLSGTADAHPGTYEIYMVNRDGSGLGPFADIDDINPSLSWSGDGKSLFVLGTSGIYQVESKGEKFERLGEGVGNAQFVWLPD